MLTPTPRWPDGLVAYDPASRLLFTSKLFSAHVGPAGAGPGPFDDGGWEAFGPQWRFFFDCMVSPMAMQVASALEKLSLEVVPTGQKPPPYLPTWADTWARARRTGRTRRL